MKHLGIYINFLFLLVSITLSAQQLPNSDFEDWSGTPFDGVAQPKSWNYSNVTQAGIKFNFAQKVAGHSGWAMKVEDQDLGALGITETSPGYISLGTPWVYLESVTKVKEATAGTHGGIAWSYRPDTLSVWIKRTGNNAMLEDFHILYYAWNGTAHGDKYKAKNGTCTEVSLDDEESDIRQSTNGNECGTTTIANQVSEGWVHGRAVYSDWTQIKVPIYYVDNSASTKMNVIFSASNYPNFRANDGLYAGNALFVDEARLIYSSKIQQLIIDGDEWKAFNPNSTAVQTYIVGDQVETIPTIKAIRGWGQLANNQGVVTTFRGRKLEGNEITITPGEIDKTPTLITVRAEDGSSETTYKIQFSHKLSNNAYLGGILVDGQSIKNFSQYSFDYTAEVKYGSTQAPVLTVIKQEENQTVSFTQPTSINDVTSIVVTAPDNQTTKTYTVRYKEAPLSDNTLQDILVNGVSIPGFMPTKTSYKVNIPVGTTQMPVVTPISKYKDGLQTITMTAPSVIEGGVYKIAVSSPGNPAPKEYKLTFSMEVSSYCKLKNIYLDGDTLADFTPDNTNYSISLPLGTTTLPVITWEAGDPYQTVNLYEGGLDGTTRIVVTAANKDQLTYRLNFTTAKSTISTLDGITLDGEMLAGFDRNTTAYSVQLPIGTTTLPEIDVIKGDVYQDVDIHLGELNGTTRITVQAGNGNTTIYQITFSVAKATDATLLGISVGGAPLPGFDSDTLEYTYVLPQGTTQLPTVEYTPHDNYQTITPRSGGVNGDYRITVRPQSGASRTYIIHFSVYKSSNSALKMIYLDGDSLAHFSPEQLDYIDTLETSMIPNVTYDAEREQRVFTLYGDHIYTIKVTAEDGSYRTYSITFVVRVSKNAFLKMIYLDGDSLADFQPERLSYTNLMIKNHTCPYISVDSEQGQQVSILSPSGAGTASIVVTAGSGDNNTYLLELIDTTTTPIPPLAPDSEYIVSKDATLRAILVDGKELDSYSPSQTLYTLNLPAGSTMPIITFDPNTEKQTVIAGRISANQYSALVTAENGDTTRYTVVVDIAPYDKAFLTSLSVEGQTIQFDPNTFVYQLSLTQGEELPQVSYTTETGASSMLNATDADHQQVIVTAQSGKQNIYTLSYSRELSNNALLSDILIDGVSLSDFDANRFHYTDTLAWHSTVVPVVNAIPGHNKQTITTAFSAINGVTRIHVVAADGVTYADYSIAFPVYQSSNVQLGELSLETDYPIQFDFDASETDYTVSLPYNAITSPVIRYEKMEAEQSISFVARPIGQANEIIVRAENGDTQTYTITFVRESAPSSLLQSVLIAINDQSSQTLPLQDDQLDYTVNLPYGTTSMAVSFTKSYSEQAVMVQPGGITNPTYLTVYSPLADTVITYIIRPYVDTQNPAILTSLSVNGTVVDGFDSNRFTYIVNCASTAQIPSITTSHNANVSATETTTYWSSTITVTSGIYTNIYRVFFHYPNDVIPNGEFNSWTKTSTSKTDKPSLWNVPGDYLKDGYLLTVNASESIKKASASSVAVSSVYWAALKGAIPPVMNIADMSAVYGVNGSTTVTPSGFIGFHNTPDQAVINYKYPDKGGNGALFRFRFVDNNGKGHNIDHVQTEAKSQYADYSVDLNISEINITGLDIIVDGANMYPQAPILGDDCSSELYIDYIRFVYNNRLKALQVNGKEAALTDNVFEVTLDVNDTSLPQLIFTGEVQDQAQQVIWNDPVKEGDYSIRRATITNYGEDGQSSDYQLVVKRPLYTSSSLKSIQVNNIQLPDFKADQLNYTYTLPYGTLSFPDVIPVLSSELQSCHTCLKDSTVTITVTSEQGKSSTYTICFQPEALTNNTLLDISAEGIIFDPEQTNYTIDGTEMPTITITKRYEEQQVVVNQGQVDVTLAGVNTTQYTIQLQSSPVTTSGQLKELELDGDVLVGFAPNIYKYEHTLPYYMAFKRMDDIDSVVYVRKPDTLFWHIFGSENHTYQLTMPDEHFGSTTLKGIYADGELLNGFNPQIDSYTIYSDSAVQLSAEGIDARQQIAIQYAQATYTIVVTAPNGIDQSTYIIRIEPTTSSDAHLSAIMIDGQALTSFQPNQYQYSIELPVGLYKDHEPVIPTIDFVTSHPKASVEIESNQLGETTYIFVTSQDGMQKTTYELLFTAEPSHNASLTAIAVNDAPLTNFQTNRYFYSVQIAPGNVTFDYRSLDRYQTVTVTNQDNQYTLHVLAQDGYTYCDYVVEVFTQALSNDATLANIMLDGVAMNDFHVELNQDLLFQPGLNRYKIYIPSRLASLPDVSASLKLDGQAVNMSRQQQTISMLVTAPDGITTNTYELQFIEVYAHDTDLKGILLDTTSLDSFSPDQHFYYIPMTGGQRIIPDVTPLWDKQTQKVSIATSALPIGQQVLIDVTAEDGVTTAQYRLIFQINPSDADTLLMLYEDGQPLQGYLPQTRQYSFELPRSTTSFPVITWDKADQYQTIVVDTLIHTQFILSCDYIVTAESGKNNRYRVSYAIQPSTNTCLKKIFINNRPLADFDSLLTEYIVTIAQGESIDTIFWEEGDTYQTISLHDTTSALVPNALATKQIHVVAESGDKRIYTLCFVESLSSDSTLSMIYYNGTPVNQYDAYQMSYSITLAQHGATLPLITYAKQNEHQSVEIHIEDSLHVNLFVTSSDGWHHSTYMLTFEPYQSSNSLLNALYIDGALAPNFSPVNNDYDTQTDSLQHLPLIGFELAEPEYQQIKIDTTYSQTELGMYVIITLRVTAENQEDYTDYTIKIYITSSKPFTPEDSENAMLSAITIRGQMLSKTLGFDQDFAPETTDYHLFYPIGTSPDIFYAISDISATAQDSLAKVLYAIDTLQTMPDAMDARQIAVMTCVHITVQAPAGNSITYNVYQELLLDSDNHATELLITDNSGNWQALKEFEPNVYYYEYTLTETAANAPQLQLHFDNTTSYFACVRFDYSNDSRIVDCTDLTNYAFDNSDTDPTYHIYYRAEDGTKYMYKVKFRRSEIKRAQKPMEGDVLIQPIPGSCQIAVASLRSNVVFGLYDLSGRMIESVKLPEGNPNSFATTTDGYGQTYFGHLTDFSNCTILSLEPNKIYCWVFTENGKRKIKSGKISFVR